MILTVIVVIAFRTSARLGLAYGLAVNCDLLLTTCFLTMVMLTVWRKNILFPLAFFLVFATIEATFLSSSILKVPKGGWFSLVLAGIYGEQSGHHNFPYLLCGRRAVQHKRPERCVPLEGQDCNAVLKGVYSFLNACHQWRRCRAALFGSIIHSW